MGEKEHDLVPDHRDLGPGIRNGSLLSLVSAQTVVLEQKLEAQYTPTKTTADRSDIVTAGAVLVLQKDNLLMDTVTSAAPISNTYKNGKISHGMGDFVTCAWCRKLIQSPRPT